MSSRLLSCILHGPQEEYCCRDVFSLTWCRFLYKCKISSRRFDTHCYIVRLKTSAFDSVFAVQWISKCRWKNWNPQAFILNSLLASKPRVFVSCVCEKFVIYQFDSVLVLLRASKLCQIRLLLFRRFVTTKSLYYDLFIHRFRIRRNK